MSCFILKDNQAIEEYTRANVEIAKEHNHLTVAANSFITKVESPAPDRLKGKRTIKDAKANHIITLEIAIPKNLIVDEYALNQIKSSAILHIPDYGVNKEFLK